MHNKSLEIRLKVLGENHTLVATVKKLFFLKIVFN